MSRRRQAGKAVQAIADALEPTATSSKLTQFNRWDSQFPRIIGCDISVLIHSTRKKIISIGHVNSVPLTVRY